VAAAFGGLNKIKFNTDDSYEVIPIQANRSRINELKSHLMIFFTGVSRIADSVAKSKIENMKYRENEFRSIAQMVEEAIKILMSEYINIDEFGRLLGRSWDYKKSLSDKITTPLIDDIYNVAIKEGALGGKILGAGGGGFILIFAKPEYHARIRDKLNKLVHVNFNFDEFGSRIALYQPQGL
jgi:D-glycero-alpha-D-manno-heptose-7-phosphate kinase